MKKKNGLRWLFTVFVVLCALSAFTLGGIFSGLLFLVLAFIISPIRRTLFKNLPEIFQRKGVLVAIGFVVGFAALLSVPRVPNTDETPSTQIDTTSVVNETDMVLPTEDRSASSSDAGVKSIEVSDTSNSSEEQEAVKKAEEEAAKKAEEEAAKKAEEEAAALKAAEEAATKQVAEQPDSSTIANGTESADALAVLQMGPTTGGPCWVPRNGGKKYHSKSSCSQMVDPIYTTVDTATACGFDACKKCH